jgi:hypothetical protein|tara:strand:- start:13 stop:1047 length:1035 start_codon:yes stop_codon:yes gene_type:complete
MTRKEKIAQQKINEKRRVDRERRNKFAVTRTTTDTQGNVTKMTPGEYGVGNIKSEASKSGLSLAGDTDKYADGSEFKKSKDSSVTQSKLSKRVADRQALKTFRKNKRAEKVAVRRGMSPQQAKDFMQNRRTRLNQALGEFGKGIMGKKQNLGNIDDRMYRKKGTGTLQNMKSKDGSTYDATAPYKGDPDKNYSNRGKGRKLVDKYEEILGSKVNVPVVSAKPLDLSPIPPQSPKEKIIETTENVTKKTTNPPTIVTKGLDSIQSSDQVPPNRVVRDNIRTRDSGGFYNTEATGNQAMQNAKQRQSSNSLSELLSKVTANPNDILDDINLKNTDRPTGAFRSRRR